MLVFGNHASPAFTRDMGFDQDIFDESRETLDRYECAVCLGVVQDPREASPRPCEHVFCAVHKVPERVSIVTRSVNGAHGTCCIQLSSTCNSQIPHYPCEQLSHVLGSLARGSPHTSTKKYLSLCTLSRRMRGLPEAV